MSIFKKNFPDELGKLLEEIEKPGFTLPENWIWWDKKFEHFDEIEDSDIQAVLLIQQLRGSGKVTPETESKIIELATTIRRDLEIMRKEHPLSSTVQRKQAEVVKSLIHELDLVLRDVHKLSDIKYDILFGRAYQQMVFETAKYMEVSKVSLSREFTGLVKGCNTQLSRVRQSIENLGKNKYLKILQQFKGLGNITSKEYKVLKEYELPTYVFPNNVFKERLGWSQGKAAQWAEIPCILFPEIHVRESNILHETQHITFGLLVRSKVVPYDKSMKENDIRDFLMYKNEILSQIIENVIPIGYSHAQFGSKVSTYVKMQTRFLYYLIKLLVKSSKNKGLQVQDFIYVVFSSETFEDLFERTLRIATGIEVSQLEIDEIDFPNKRSRVKFMKCIRRIREKKIVSKVDGWGQAIT